MHVLTILGIAVGLSLDAVAVAAAISISIHPVTRKQVFRLAFHFGLFQAIMPVLGWILGQTIQEAVAAWDHWLVFGLLAGVGIKAMVTAVRTDKPPVTRATDPTRGWSLVAYSVLVSSDALAAGISFAMLDVTIWYAVLPIGIITALLTAISMAWGSRMGARYGWRLEFLGGAVLVAIGLLVLCRNTLWA